LAQHFDLSAMHFTSLHPNPQELWNGTIHVELERLHWCVLRSGDMDLNPDTGQYRISASISPVDVNALRATLGARPTPHPVAGAVRGVLHCTGPLEEPIFSGTAVAVRPSADMLAAGEATHALAAVAADPDAASCFWPWAPALLLVA
jgi:hypothetical protein